MFEALINRRVDTCGIDFELSFADIEQLNAQTLARKADISKVSYAILSLIADDYSMISSGSALGRGNGPLLVARDAIDLSNGGLKVAVPGEHTTANLLIQRIFPALKKRTPVLFSEIAERVASGEFDAGVLIHEGRFTYTNKKLHLCADLGSEWERRTAMPLPLGGIAVARNLGGEIAKTVENIVRASVEYALANPDVSRDFVREHAREMDSDVIQRHIELFVNEFSVDIGDIGRQAVEALTGVKI
jgi:1,4-dihydroxy-6-naphthoate synthase